MAIEQETIEHAALEPSRYRFTVEQYHEMGAAGIFKEGDRVQLIDGEIIRMNPIGDPHAGTVNFLGEVFFGEFRGRAVVAIQNPVRLGPHDEPEPDLALLRFRADRYRTSKPTPEDVLLLIEVSDSSVRFDRAVKGARYSAHGIPEYWQVVLGQGQLVVYRDPGPDGYRSTQVLQRGDTINLVAFSDVTIAVTDILG